MGTRQNRLSEALVTSTHNPCFEQKCEKIYQNFYLKTFQFLVKKCSIYLNRRVFVMEVKEYCEGQNLAKC